MWLSSKLVDLSIKCYRTIGTFICFSMVSKCIKRLSFTSAKLLQNFIPCFSKTFFCCCCNRFCCSLFFRLQKSPRVLKGLSFQTFEIFCVRSEASNFPATTSFLAQGKNNKLKNFFQVCPNLLLGFEPANSNQSSVADD